MAGVLPKVIAVFGPTASGKSAVAEALSEQLGGPVVSADAFQVYTGLPLLTNQPGRFTELVGIWPLEREASVGEYQPLAHACIDAAVAEGRVPVLCGGTGLYLRAALSPLSLPPAPAPDRRAAWERAYDDNPAQAHAELSLRDPAAARSVHVHDRRRVVRALELTELGTSLRPGSSELWSYTPRWPTLVIGLDVPRDVLERRIVARTQQMFAAGVVDEVRAALAAGVSRTAEKALGLAEIAALEPAEAEQQLVVRTRRYAAYQRKWMRRIPGLVAVDADRPAVDVAADILTLAGRPAGRTT